MVILLLTLSIASACNQGYYQDPSDPTGGSCLQCNKACASCSSPGANNCIHCLSSYPKLNQICIQQCPLGFINTNSVCQDNTTDKIALNLNFSNLQNSIQSSSSQIVALSAGNSSDFYPNYDSFDPYVIKDRGFYFDGSAYIKGDDYSLTFASVFTLALWIKPDCDTCFLFSKQTKANLLVGLKLDSWYLSFTVLLASEFTVSSTTALNPHAWNFAMVKMSMLNFQAAVSFVVNTVMDFSLSSSTYYTDTFADFYTTFAAQFSSGYTGFYTGYMWMFKISNQELSASSFLQASNCEGCLICPLNNDNKCLSVCGFQDYINGTECEACSSQCQTFGCVRRDVKCNLCADQKCLKCQSFGSGCVSCVPNAYISAESGLCTCEDGFIWDSINEECASCEPSCKACDGGGYLGCSECKENYFLLWGICLLTCPTGYKSSEGNCVLSGGSRLFDMKFNETDGVVYDLANLVPAVTGSSPKFYPDFEADDPIVAQSRGFYFTGESLMHLAPYLTYTDPVLVLPPVCYIAVWLNPVISEGIIFSSVNSSFSPMIVLSLQNLYPSILLNLADSSSSESEIGSLSCSQSLNLNSWSYIALKITLDQQERTFITCYINNVAEDTSLLGQGHLVDSGSNIKLIGTQQISSEIYSLNYFKGFVYQIIIDSDTDAPLSGYSVSCESGCSTCPTDRACLSNCHIDEYPSGTDGTNCSKCNEACAEFGCTDGSSTCGPSSVKRLVVVYIAIGIAALWVVLLCCLLSRDKRESESKIFIDKILSGVSSAGYRISNVNKPNLQGGDSVKAKIDSSMLQTSKIEPSTTYFHEKNPNQGNFQGIRRKSFNEFGRGGLQASSGFEDDYEDDNLVQVVKRANYKAPTTKVATITNILPLRNFEDIYYKYSKRFTYSKNKTQSKDLSEDERSVLKRDEQVSFGIPEKKEASKQEKKLTEAMENNSEPNLEILVSKIEDSQPKSAAEINTKDSPGIDFKPSNDRSPAVPIKVDEESKEAPEDYLAAKERKIPASNFLGADLKKPAEVNFNVPDTITAVNSARRIAEEEKHEENDEIHNFDVEEERRYPALVVNYYFSAIAYFHETFSRASRCTQAAESILIQILITGLAILMNLAGRNETIDSYWETLRSVGFVEITVLFSVAIISNLLTGLLLCAFFRKKLTSAFHDEYERTKAINRNRKLETAGLILAALLISGIIVEVGFIEVSITSPQLTLWLSYLFLQFLLDFFCIQLTKVTLYYFFIPHLILPG